MNVKINIHVSPERAVLAGKTEAGVKAIGLSPEFLGLLTERQKKIVAKEAGKFSGNYFPEINQLFDYSEQSVINRLIELESEEMEKEAKEEKEKKEYEAKKIAEIAVFADLSIEEIVRDYDLPDSKYWNILNRYPELSEILESVRKFISDRREARKKEEDENKDAQIKKFNQEFLRLCSPIQTRKWIDGLMSSNEKFNIIKNHVFYNVGLQPFENKPASSKKVYSLSDDEYMQIEKIKKNLKVSEMQFFDYVEDALDYGSHREIIRVVEITVCWNGMDVFEEFVFAK
jgi:hypothetical protein